ncbi:MAG: lysophospholipid acyltransferase family protein, partial [Pirellulaceae bacterium]|nr:lysophospholipid acyltransferase family protein [Pirellulaceae bacterium]
MSAKETFERPLWKRVGYYVVWISSRVFFAITSQLRIRGASKMPRHGGMLVCSNHQSHFDPVLVGISFRRRMNYLARKSLFDVPVLNWLIHYLDAIPIERDGMGIGGIKETLRRLKRGESVLIFPEGTRTADGRLQPLKPGFYAIAKRSKCPILPVAVAGAYQMWPRDRSFPGIGRVAVSVGDPISAEA